MTLISVIIPVYNVEKYLNRCIDSLLAQTLRDIEVICINDCSTDSSLDILNKYSANDERLKIIDLKEKVGASIARNKGLEIAQGEYIGFVDADDALDTNFYEVLYRNAVEKKSDITKGAVKLYNYNGDVCILDKNEIIRKNKYYFTAQFWSAIYKASFIFDNEIKFPDECPKGQDIVFLNRAVLKSNFITVIDDVFYHYYRHKDSLDSPLLPLKYTVSDLTAKKLIAEDINSSNLFEVNRDIYNEMYLFNISRVIPFLFRAGTTEGKLLFGKALIDLYKNCKDKEYLEENFPYPWMLSYIKQNKCDEFSRILAQYKKEKHLIYSPKTFIQKIFSVENYKNERLLLYILGICISIKIKK